MSHGYAYAAAPQAVTGAAQARAGYRGKQTTQQLAKDQTLPAHQANLMYDKRIVRGSTYALSHRLASHVPGMPGATGPFAGKHGGAARRHAAAAASTGSTATYTTYETYPRVMTPPAVEGRVHTEVQTDNYLEDLRETNNKVEFATQTMPELDRPSQPLFKPLEPIFYPLSEAKSVALMTDADELFDFDLTVEPLLSTLCDRGMEDAMMEVLEEEEQKEIRRGVSAFHQVHSAAVQVMQDKEHREARLAEEVYARAEQERTYLTEKHTAASKAAARRAARDALQVVAESALARLDDAGFFLRRDGAAGRDGISPRPRRAGPAPRGPRSCGRCGDGADGPVRRSAGRRGPEPRARRARQAGSGRGRASREGGGRKGASTGHGCCALDWLWRG